MMEAIQSIGSNSLYTGASGIQAVGNGSATNESSNLISIASSQSVTSAVLIDGQVESMLSGIDEALAGNETLKLLIAALIMNALFSNDTASGQSSQNALSALEGLSGGRYSAIYLTMESSTTTIQMQTGSGSLDTLQAIQSMAQSGFTGGGQGGQLDLSV